MTDPLNDSGGPHGVSGWRERFSLWVTEHPWTVVIVATVAAALSVLVSVRSLKLDANTDSLIDPDRPFMVLYREFLDEFGDLEGITIAVDPRGDDAAAKRAVDALEIALSALPDVPHAVGRITPEEQWRLAPWSMPPAQLKELLRARDAFPALLDARKDAEALCVLASARDLLAATLANGMTAPRDAQESRVASALLLLDAVCPPESGDSLASRREAEYLRSDGGSLLFVQIQPEKDFSSLATIEPLLQRVRGEIAKVRRGEPAVEIGLTGKPVLQADELATSNADTSRGTAIAAVIVVVLLIAVFRSGLRPMLAALALGLTFACTYGAATLLVGRLNLLSLVFMLVLVSAGVDYGIHTLAHHADWRSRVPPSLAPRRAMVVGFVPIWVGAATSAVVFFLALVTDFGGLRELGVIGGSGLLICAAMMTVVLPALLTLAARFGMDRAWWAGSTRVLGVDRGTPARIMSGRAARGVLLAALAVSAISAALLPRVSFESNLLKLQAEGLESIEWEQRILDDSTSASWFGAIICPDEVCVDRVRMQAATEPTIARTVSVRDVMPAATSERATLLGNFAAACDVKSTPCDSTADTVKGDAGDMTALGGTAAAALANLNRLLTLGALGTPADQLAPLRERSDRLQALVSALQQPVSAGDAVKRANENVRRAAAALRAMAEGAAASQREALPNALRDRMMSDRNSYLVSLLPKADIWEPEPLAAFTAALRRIDDGATGAPFTVHESLIDMREAFVTMALWSLVSVAGLVWLDLRTLRATGVAIGVLLLGMLWTFGCMGACGVSLNLANFFGVPMLLGLGVDGAIHILHRAREGGDPLAWIWTQRAVLLSAVTTAAGFATLVVASHRGLQSLGWLIVMGSIFNLLSCLVVLPALLRVFPDLAGKRQPPTDGGAGGDAAPSP
jgi:predicted RND superfamily exporter protein